MTNYGADIGPTELIQEEGGYPYVPDGRRLLGSKRGAEAIAKYLTGFDEFDAALVLEDLQAGSSSSFFIKPDRLLSNRVPNQEKENPWTAAIELAKILGTPVLVYLGGGFQFVTGQSCQDEIQKKGAAASKRIAELKKYREVDINAALASEDLQRILARDYRLTTSDLSRIKTELTGPTFIATKVDWDLRLSIQHLIESRDKFDKPTVMRFNFDLLIANFGAKADTMEADILATWEERRKQAALRSNLGFEEFQNLDPTDSGAVLAWLLRAEEQGVYFEPWMISDIEERLSLHGFSGAPVNFFDHYYSEDDRELKKIVSALNDQDFNDLLINVGISVLGSNGDVRFLRSLIAYRASLSAS